MPHTIAARDGSWSSGTLPPALMGYVTFRRAGHVPVALHRPPVGDRGDRRRGTDKGRSGAGGDISLRGSETANRFIAWSQPQAAPYNPSQILYGDVLYTLLDRGFFTVHDARTGEEIYSRRRIAVGAAFTASPWAYDDKVFALSEDGDAYVIRAGGTFEVIGRNPLDEFTMATPAIAQGSLFIRTRSKLYRIAEAAAP